MMIEAYRRYVMVERLERKTVVVGDEVCYTGKALILWTVMRSTNYEGVESIVGAELKYIVLLDGNVEGMFKFVVIIGRFVFEFIC